MINSNFIGRLGADCEEKSSQNGNKFLTMNVAVDNYHKGERSTIWVRVAAIGERHTRMKEYLTKGKLVSVSGPLQTSIYTNKNGENMIAYDVTADRIDFINVGGSGSTQTSEASASTGTFKPQTNGQVSQMSASAPQSNDADDLPF